MRVLRLYVQDCGVFSNHMIDFTHTNNEPQDIICIAGVNGTGKTTILELIFNLLALLNPEFTPQNIVYDRLKPNILTRVKFAQLDLMIDGNILSIVAGQEDQVQRVSDTPQEFIIEPEIGAVIREFENSIVKTPNDPDEPRFLKNFSTKLIFKSIADAENSANTRKNSRQLNFFAKLVKQISENLDSPTNQESGNELPFVYFFSSNDREIKDMRYESISQEKVVYNITSRYNPTKDDLKKVFIYYEYAYPDKFESLKNWLNVNVLVGKTIEKIDRPNFNVLIKSKSSQYHGLELLSSGEESLLIIAVQIYLRAHKNSIFVIDEIDQSLHPEFQEKIITIVKKLQEERQCQIVMSSHSSIVWDFFDKQGLIDLTSMAL